MINDHDQIVCDTDKIVVDDGITFMPGYLTTHPKSIITHTGIDEYSSRKGMFPRSQFKQESRQSVETNLEGRLDFCSEACMNAYKNQTRGE